jgi:hypothetical protein
VGKEQEESGLCHAWIENVFCVWFQGKFRRDGSEHDLESSLFISFFKSRSAVYINNSYPYTLCLLSPTFFLLYLLSPLIITLGLCYTFRRPRRSFFFFYRSFVPLFRRLEAPATANNRVPCCCPSRVFVPSCRGHATCGMFLPFFFLVFFSRHFSAQ